MADTDRYADGRYLTAHPQWHAERSPWKAGHVVTGLRAVDASPISMCDIGCGTARVLAHVVRALPGVGTAVGFEPSPDAPLHPDAQGIVERRQVDATTSTDHFDVALMLDVFEHVADHLGFLEACRPLADTFVFHIPLEINVHTVLTGKLGDSRDRVGHLHTFTRRTALDTLRDCGYTPMHDHFTKSGWDGPGKTPWTPVNIVRRATYTLSPSLAERLVGGLSLLVVARPR
jgi:SAM-dependent methyltransferase